MLKIDTWQKIAITANPNDAGFSEAFVISKETLPPPREVAIDIVYMLDAGNNKLLALDLVSRTLIPESDITLTPGLNYLGMSQAGYRDNYDFQHAWLAYEGGLQIWDIHTKTLTRDTGDVPFGANTEAHILAPNGIYANVLYENNQTFTNSLLTRFFTETLNVPKSGIDRLPIVQALKAWNRLAPRSGAGFYFADGLVKSFHNRFARNQMAGLVWIPADTLGFTSNSEILKYRFAPVLLGDNTIELTGAGIVGSGLDSGDTPFIYRSDILADRTLRWYSRPYSAFSGKLTVQLQIRSPSYDDKGNFTQWLGDTLPRQTEFNSLSGFANNTRIIGNFIKGGTSSSLEPVKLNTFFLRIDTERASAEVSTLISGTRQVVSPPTTIATGVLRNPTGRFLQNPLISFTNNEKTYEILTAEKIADDYFSVSVRIS